MNNTANKLLIACAITGLLTACATAVVPLQPGAENIKVITSPVPKSCKLLGQVERTDKNGQSQSYASHEHLQQDALNTLRNQGLKLGANVIALNQHDAVYAKHSLGKESVAKVTVLDNHTMAGNAYVCPTNIANQLSDSSQDIKE